MASMEAAVVFNGLARKGGLWHAAFSYEASGLVWLEASIEIPDHIPDDQLVSYGRHVFHQLMTVGREKTMSWTADVETLTKWKIGG